VLSTASNDKTFRRFTLLRNTIAKLTVGCLPLRREVVVDVGAPIAGLATSGETIVVGDAASRRGDVAETVVIDVVVNEDDDGGDNEATVTSVDSDDVAVTADDVVVAACDAVPGC
jgi:hypothetical protein